MNIVAARRRLVAMTRATLPLLALAVGAQDDAAPEPAPGPAPGSAPKPAPGPGPGPGPGSGPAPEPNAYTFQRVRAWWAERQRYSVVQAGMVAAFLVGTLFLSAFTLPLLLRH